MATPRAFDTTHLTTCYPSSEPRDDNPWEPVSRQPASIGTIAAAPLLMDFELAEPDHDPGSGSPRDATVILQINIISGNLVSPAETSPFLSSFHKVFNFAT